MLFIFGWGHQKNRDYGPTLPIKCSNCNNEVFLHLVHSKVWFTLFFIPLIPYESKYYLLCEVCFNGIMLNGSQIDIAKKLNQTTLSLINQQISEEQYEIALMETHMLE